MRKSAFYLLLFLLLWGFGGQALAVTVAVSNMSGQVGAVVTIPILVDTAEGIAGAEIVLSYDPTILTEPKARTTALTAGFAIADSIVPGKIVIVLARDTGIIEGSGSFIAITFKISDTAKPGDSCALILRKVALYKETTELIPVTTVNGSFTVVAISVLPNPFTPNNDGFNDYVDFKFPNMFTKECEILIFDISGRQVRRLSAPDGDSFKWRGMDDDGQRLEPGIYIYIIRVDREVISNGTITLMR